MFEPRPRPARTSRHLQVLQLSARVAIASKKNRRHIWGYRGPFVRCVALRNNTELPNDIATTQEIYQRVQASIRSAKRGCIHTLNSGNVTRDTARGPVSRRGHGRRGEEEKEK
ncbi:hypothetical protein PsYK624_058670 [Phanerochaete sordida]|uniref:Uncharacterized protein n=1 Tax=Phanerochaete sordida TaxID=48140 RepID=A0A9P3G976_9APHY|nr:hypothetical protein PsYK624_058670 [Phanerochaete sordida]